MHAIDESDESLEYLSSDVSDTDSTESSLSDHEMETSCSTSLLAATYVPSSASVPLLETKTSLPFKLVGDNIDKNVRPRYLRSSIHRTESLHYFHSYTVRDRIGFNELPHKQPSSCLPSKHTLAESILPSPTDDALKINITTLVSRILVKHIDIFNKSFPDVVDWHINHKYYRDVIKVRSG